jgi:hypothetical protein
MMSIRSAGAFHKAQLEALEAAGTPVQRRTAPPQPRRLTATDVRKKLADGTMVEVGVPVKKLLNPRRKRK